MIKERRQKIILIEFYLVAIHVNTNFMTFIDKRRFDVVTGTCLAIHFVGYLRNGCCLYSKCRAFLKNFINIEKVNIVFSHSTSFNEENEIIAVCYGQSSENNLHVLKMECI